MPASDFIPRPHLTFSYVSPHCVNNPHPQLQAGVVLAGDRSETGTGTGYASSGGGGESGHSRRSTGSDIGAADVATTVLLRSHPVSVWPLYSEMARVWFRSTAAAWARGEEDAESATEEASLASVLPPDPRGEVCNHLCNVASPNLPRPA